MASEAAGERRGYAPQKQLIAKRKRWQAAVEAGQLAGLKQRYDSA